ncbi:MAG TPA: molybdopterin-dependent oxidoreductase [Selenomonadales bacterium]|nr:molybdopterin-dependent oxidoreductase [Selenomonadales bacterium]
MRDISHKLWSLLQSLPRKATPEGFRRAVEGPEPGETIVISAGPHNCGGRCMAKIHVRDGVITRITTDPAEDSPAEPALKSCLRCRSYRTRQYHPDRLKYPMRRVGRRGEGRFERISWDEACDLIARQIERISAEYGREALYIHYATGNAGALSGVNFARRLLALGGGYLNYYNNYSNPCATWAMNYTYGDQNAGSSREDWLNARLMLLWGFNPAETVFGTNTMYYLRLARERGTRMIAIDPRYTDTAAALADEWIAVRPTTDNALMDAMAYVMIRENLQDQAFLDRFCLGFDEGQMPSGIPPGNSYKSYVLGLGTDKTAKTPGWAEAITGVPREAIVKLAREYALTKPAAILCGYGIQRHAYGEQPPRGAAALSAMTGNVGRPGGSAGAMGFPGYGRAPRIGSVGAPNPVKAAIPVYLWTDAVLRGRDMGPQDGVQGVDRLPAPIKAIFNLAGNTLVNQHGNINRTAAILADDRLCEFIVVSDQFMTPSAKFADILLPGTTHLERLDLVTPWAWGDYVLFMDKAVEPLYECKNDYAWLRMVAERLGLGAAFAEDRTEEEWLRFVIRETQALHPGFPDLEELRVRGIYQFRHAKPHVAFSEQIENPGTVPFATPSGKIEIFSPRLWAMGNHREIPPTPRYIPAWEGPQDELAVRYPLQCIGPHSKRRAHSTFDNSPWLEEAAPQRMAINPADAAARGIRDGDRARVFNERGELMIGVRVTSRIMPGVVAIPQGAWWDPDENGVDRRGSINVLTSHRPTPLARANPQHTLLVEVERVGERRPYGPV